jgi:hypothetical protein
MVATLSGYHGRRRLVFGTERGGFLNAEPSLEGTPVLFGSKRLVTNETEVMPASAIKPCGVSMGGQISLLSAEACSHPHICSSGFRRSIWTSQKHSTPKNEHSALQ